MCVRLRLAASGDHASIAVLPLLVQTVAASSMPDSLDAPYFALVGEAEAEKSGLVQLERPGVA